MEERRDYIALDWISTEIQETLQQALQEMDAYVQNVEDTTKLRFALSYVHQVHGSLKMIEFPGAALLAEELEYTLQALIQQKVSQQNIDDALFALKNGIRQIPAYLTQVKKIRSELPAVLIGLINDLRSVRGQVFASQSLCFNPAPFRIEGQRIVLAQAELSEMSAKLRQMFQIALLGYLRGNEPEKNLNYLAKVFARMAKLCDGREQQGVWKAAIALVEGLLNQGIVCGPAIKSLLRQLDPLIKSFVEKGDLALDNSTPEHLLRNILFYISTSKINSRYISEIRSTCQLDKALPDSTNLEEVSISAIDGRVVNEIIERIGITLRELSAQKIRHQNDTQQLRNLLPEYRNIIDAISIIGMLKPLRSVQEEYTSFSKQLSTAISSNEVAASAKRLVKIADDLVSIKEKPKPTLFNNSVEAQEHLDKAQAAVIKESRNLLEQIKEAIIEFVARQWQHDCLENLPSQLKEVSGSLNLASLNRAALVIDSCESFVSKNLLSHKNVPEWKLLDTLADAIASIDYYLELIGGDSEFDATHVLSVAEQSASRLNDATNVEVYVAEVSEPSESHSENIQDNTLITDSVALESQNVDIENQIEEAGNVEESNNFTQPTFEQKDAQLISEELLDDEYDPEIVEIFIEEAGEVIDTINEYFSRWLNNPYDSEVMPIIRRAFHTLKGSGRMVGATDIGEMAWSIENMLNRVIDGTVQMDQQRLDLVTEAKNLAPIMVEAFSARRRCNMTPVQSLIEKAFLLAKEQNPTFNVVENNNESEEILEQAMAASNEQEEILLDVVHEDVIEDIENVEAVQLSQEKNEDVSDEILEEGSNDTELLDIFSAEASSHLKELSNFIDGVMNHGVFDISENLQRALHTLKGSANMAGILPVAEVVTPVEKMVKETRAAQLPVDEELLSILIKTAEFIRAGIKQLSTTPYASLKGSDQFIAEVEASHQQRLFQLHDDYESGVDSDGIPPEVLSQFLMDVMDHLVTIGDEVSLWRADKLSHDRVQTLPGVAEQVVTLAAAINISPIENLAQSLSNFLQKVIASENKSTYECFSLITVAVDTLIDMLDRIAGQQEPQSHHSLIEKLEQFGFSQTPVVEVNELSTESFDNDEIVIDLPVVDDGDLTSESDVINNDFTENVFGDLSEETEFQEIKNEDEESLSSNSEQNILDSFVDSLLITEQEEIESHIVANAIADDVSVENFDGVEGGEYQDAIPLMDVVDSSDDVSLVVNDESASTDDYDFVLNDQDSEEIDPDILEIFLEEAADLLEGLDETVAGWINDPESNTAQDEMQRLLHTLKGGARLSGLKQLGNLTHHFETFLIEAQQKNIAIDNDFLAKVQMYQDQLVQRVDAIRRGEKEKPFVENENVNEITQEIVQAEENNENSTIYAPSSDLANTIDTARAEDDSTNNERNVDNVLPFNRSRSADSLKDIVPFTARKETTAVPAATIRRNDNIHSQDDLAIAQSFRKAPQESIKISAQLLEQLVNLAGETSISRGRVEAQVSEILFSLEDMQATVNRLQDQLRRLDSETEAQIVFRQEQLETEGAEDFDPLEFDRYSVLQQLARSLMESASDLTDIRGTLVDKSKDMETLLVQQSRINTELQEGLMRSRMVPFSRMVPRLRRIVRQVASELDKDVEMYVENAEGELDRTMLEKINAPLEHMLRNAVDHGIESVEERIRAGKSSQGSVRLALNREGADVVLTLEDDGAGIDVIAVKEKAIERGLLSKDAIISDREVLQFIMQPGFSTAKKVTQISGRGVGMDVVASEIKQLGGSIDIQSIKGQGTRFIVRLPFTVSINRALMVTVGGDTYAIPLNTIEGIVRISPFELEAYYQPDAPSFEYAGQPYSVRYLGSLLRTQQQPNLEGVSLPLPVLLVRAGDHAIAVQVDSLQGSREVVVKSLGAQFAMVQGLSGATVLGDGSVVVILDLMAMLRAEILQASRHSFLESQEQKIRNSGERQLLVMVVDDSVTVRKVTTRFLERQGMEVITAKDGADAMAHLLETDRLPDVMLLDIEMPRMDGFEVASRVRHSNRLKDIPIIMITSRTGDKHRDRAMSLGVNRYLGKPYQENVVLENIAELTAQVH